MLQTIKNRSKMRKAFITGANKGIGRATAKRLLQNGYHVYIGSRSELNGADAVDTLKAEGFTHVEMVQLDVTDGISVQKAREEIGKNTDVLDVLINNAGINGGSDPYTALEAMPEEFQRAFNTNVVGTASVTKAFIDLLQKSDMPRIVNVSTSVGSLALQSDPDWPAYHYAKYAVYASSKAALNMYTIHLAYELRDTRFKINAVCPGLTATDFTFGNGGDVDTAAERVVKYAMIDEDGPTGQFFSEETNPETGQVPW